MSQRRLAELSASTFHEMVADPDVYVGGGSAAAMTGAGAAATALLVLRLNVRRKSLADRRDEIERDISTAERVMQECTDAADEDTALLDHLLRAHQTLRKDGDPAPYVAALTDAADSPVRIARSLVELLEVIDRHVELSTRFTVSDLGAAAVLADGAAQAALLTAEVNIALLMEQPGSDVDLAHSLYAAASAAREKSKSLAASIERRTMARLRGQTKAKEVP